MHTVKQLSDLAGVSIRTLHYYDEIGLLNPSEVGENGYRYYSDDALFRLQQILLYREMDLGLLQIKEILDAPEFDRVAALQTHRQTLQDRIERLQTLIKTIDTTILHSVGEVNMSKKKIFDGFTQEEEKKYKKEAMQRYDKTIVKQSYKLWNSYSAEKKEQVKQEGGAVYDDLVKNMDKGPESDEAQAILARWHQHLRYFYEPTLPILRGLGNMYNESPDFNATFTAMHTDLPAFLQKAINHYVDALEIAELEKELALLESVS